MAGSIHKSQFATSVKFEVDQASLASLKDALQDVSTAASKARFQGELTQELNDAAKAAEHLSDILTQSWNTKLNQFDLTKLNNSIKESYGSVEALRLKLDAGGAVGANAFNKIGQAVLSTNIQLKQSNAWLDKMAITMSNTIRFGISSSIMNSFTGSIQKAYNYVQKLDKSLNDIRIVSNASADQMDRFAKYANKAAQNLGSSTLDYTQAALIYYQQGLVEDQVKERSDITVKMAHVTESTAQEVSDQLTAIWNNFYDGSQSLEYYADVLAKLGAETASSSEEISQGLEKFAAVSKTVGLSYEYAAAALTTVTATTRQSADVVGTAFKTLFARIQDLELGKTLEDGTTLGKYAEALEAVGVNIKDDFGNLKNMDVILDEMGSKWKTLSNDQKVALAQNVAGVRQYTQLMSLMENWDFFQKNVNSARNATGALQKQQEIYLDSIAAHMEQLSAQAEKFYSNILNSKAIKTFTDLLTGALKTVNTYMTGLGGGFNSLFSLGGNAVALFSKQIGGIAAKRSINKEIAQQNAANVIAQQDWVGKTAGTEAESKATREGLELETQYYEKILGIREQLNEQELVEANNNLRAIGELRERISFAENWQEIATSAAGKTIENENELKSALDKENESRKEVLKTIEKSKSVLEEYKKYAEEDPNGAQDSKDAEEHFTKAISDIAAYRKELSKKLNSSNPVEKEQIELYKQEDEWLAKIEEKIKSRTPLMAKEEQLLLKGMNQELAETSDKVHALEGSQRGLKEATDGTVVALKAEEEQRKNNINQMEHEKELAKGYSDVTRTIGLLTSSITAVVGVIKTWQDKDLEPWERFKSIAAVIGAQGFQIIKHWKDVTSAFKFMNTTILPKLLVNFGLVESAEAATAMTAGQMWLAILGPATLVIATLAAIGAAIYMVYLQETAAAREIKSFDEAIESLNQKVEDLENTVSDLKSAWDSVKNAEDVLSGCVRYSDEWKEQLKNVNSTIEDILAKYPELLGIQGMVLHDPETGRLILNKEEWDKYIEKQEKLLKLQKAALAVAQSHEQELTLSNELTKWGIPKSDKPEDKYNVSHKMLWTTGSEGRSSQGVDITFTKDELLKLAGMNSKEERTELLNSIAARIYHERNDDQVFQDPFTLKEFQDSMLNMFGDNSIWKDLNNTIQKTNALLDNTNALLVPEEVSKEGKYATNLYTDKLNSGKWIDELKNQENAGVHEISEQNDEDAKTFLRNYIEATGQTWDSSKFTNVDGDDNNRVYYYDGEPIKLEEMTSYLSSAIQSGQYKFQTWKDYGSGTSWDKFKNNINKNAPINAEEIIEKAQKDKTNTMTELGVSEDLADKILSQNLDSLTTEDVTKLKEIEDKITPYFEKMFGKEAGATKAKEFIEGFKDYDMTKAAKNLNDEIESIYEQGAAATGHTVAGIKDVAKMFKQTEEGSKLSDKALAKYAVTAVKFNKNMTTVKDTVDSNIDALKNWQKAGRDYTKWSDATMKAAEDLQKSIKDSFGVDVDLETLQANFDTIQKAIKGDKKALLEFQKLLANDQLDNMKLNWEFNTSEEEKQTQINNFNQLIDNMIDKTKNLKIGAEFDDDEAIQQMNDFIAKSGMTYEQVQGYFDKIGYDPDIGYTETEQVVGVQQTVKVGENGLPVLVEEEVKEKVQIPYIKAVKKAPGFKDYKPTKPTKKKKSGGGSGGSSTKKKKEAYSKDEFDRYHVVNTQISKIDNALKKLQKQEEKTLGKKLLDNLIKQWQNLEKQVDNYKEKLKIAQGEYRELEKNLTKKGVKFNDDGTVANYFDALKKQEAEYNKVVKWFNKLSAKEQNKEANQKKLNDAKEAYEKFKNELDRIDTLASNEIPNIVQSMHDAIDEEIENNIKAFSLEVDLSLDLKEAQQQWNDFKHKIMNGLRDEDILGNARLTQNNLSTLLSQDENGNYKGDLVNQIEHVQEILDQINKQKNGESNVYGDNTKAALDDLKKYFDEARNSYEQAVEYQKQLHQDYLDMLDQAKEKLDAQKENYEQITNLLEHDKRLVELTYGEKAYAILDKYYKLQKQNNKDELQVLANQEKYYKTRMDNAQAEMLAAKAALRDENLTADEYEKRNSKYLETVEKFEKTKEHWTAAVEASNSMLETSIGKAQESLENTLNLINQTMAQALTGKAGGLGYAEEEWDLINRNADQYLDTINRLQGENTLESKYLESINKAVNPSIQKKLKDAMDSEMKALREKDKLTQYDLDRANKRYQIMLAQIALEEAQQNKNKMRLRRDSQGNYRYQYVADEDQINKAKEELSSLYADLYNFDKEKYKSNLSEMEALTKEYQEKVAELSKINDPQERLEQELLLRQQYEPLFVAIQEETEVSRKNLMDSAFDDLVLLYDESKDKYLAMTEEETNALMSELVPAWSSTYAAIAKNMEPLDFINEALDRQAEAWEATQKEIEEYLEILDKSKEQIKEAVDEVGNAIDKDIQKVEEFIEENQDLINAYETNLTSLEDMISSTDELIDRYKTEIEQIGTLTDAYKELETQMQSNLETYDEYASNPIAVTDPGVGEVDETPGGTESEGSGGGDTETPSHPTITDKLKKQAWADVKKSSSKMKTLQKFLKNMGYNLGKTGKNKDGVDGSYGEKTKAAIKKFQKLIGMTGDDVTGKFGPGTWKKAKATGYDTGGYTGEWGSDGRLAFLHQKELVLNTKDTENILNTVAIMRNLMASLNENVLSRLVGVSAGSISGIGGNDLLEQNVHIEANFPNVTSSNEIEEAIKNLVNVASQRVTK